MYIIIRKKDGEVLGGRCGSVAVYDHSWNLSEGTCYKERVYIDGKCYEEYAKSELNTIKLENIFMDKSLTVPLIVNKIIYK